MPTFKTRDWYLAGYFHIFAVPLLGVRLLDDGRCEFEFANPDRQATNLFQDFKAGDGRDLVSVNDFRLAYRAIAHAAQAARNGVNTDDDDPRDNTR